MSHSADLPGGEQIETVWAEFTSDRHERLYDELRAAIRREIDERCKRQINAGDYDATVALADVFDWFRAEHLTDDSRFVEAVLESDAVYFETLEYDRERLGHLVFERLVADLEERDELLYIADRQRVRSQVAEMARYFALVRQRLDAGGGTAIEFSPNLVKMVKMDIIDREQPIVDPERAATFGDTLRQLNRRLSGDDVAPAAELEETLGDDWLATVRETVEFMGEFLEDGLPDAFQSLADYQARSFIELYLDAVTRDEGDRSHVITASTGGGKTEAFLLPVLAYCHTAWAADIGGNNAVLTYPRQDLCNNQFERLVDYAFTINEQLGHADATLAEAPISVAIQHGARDDVEIDCPYCEADHDMEPLDWEDDFRFACTEDDDHVLEWATTDRSAPADVIVTTQDSLHIRLMDKYGNGALWSSDYPTKFLVLDEVSLLEE